MKKKQGEFIMTKNKGVELLKPIQYRELKRILIRKEVL